MKNNSIPINERLCLTVEEAAEYSLMGERRLRKLIEENKNLDWVLYVGGWTRIKRPQFENWVLNQTYI